MSEYDSILKEKKKYQEITPTEKTIKKKRFPYIKLSLFFTILILGISYFIYYRTILSPDKIFLSDLSYILNQYQKNIDYLPIEVLNSNYHLEGTLKLEEKEYNYGIIRQEEKLKIDLSIGDDYLEYYLDSNNSYIKLSNIGEEYILLNNNYKINDSANIKNNFSNYITSDKYIKKFYLNGYTPIVEVNLSLSNEDIEQILRTSSLKEQYEILFTFKNNALTNEIISMKIAINNLTNKSRITYQNNEINYSDGIDKNIKLSITQKKEDFSIKIYQNDILYSVLSGSKNEDSYKYMYQVIDQIYNISLNVTKGEENHYKCELISNIKKNDIITKKEATITINNGLNTKIEEINTTNIKQYKSFTEDEKETYQKALEKIIGNLRKFIQEYQ